MKSAKIKAIPTLPKELMGRKASEVFLEYSQPCLEFCFRDRIPDNLEKFEKIFMTPWTVWNADVMSNVSGNNVDYLAMIRLSFKNASVDVKQLVDLMIKRKNTLYGKYQYMLGKYALRFDNVENDIKLSVETKMPPKKIGK